MTDTHIETGTTCALEFLTQACALFHNAESAKDRARWALAHYYLQRLCEKPDIVTGQLARELWEKYGRDLAELEAIQNSPASGDKE